MIVMNVESIQQILLESDAILVQAIKFQQKIIDPVKNRYNIVRNSITIDERNFVSNVRKDLLSDILNSLNVSLVLKLQGLRSVQLVLLMD